MIVLRILRVSLAIACVGVAVVFVGVVSPALFYPGVVIIALGLVGTALAGLFAMFASTDTA
jgi:hypothetical protein